MPIAGLGRLASALHSREQGVCAIAGRRARFLRLSPLAGDLDLAPAARSTPSRLTAPLSLGPLRLSRPCRRPGKRRRRPCRGPGAAWIASNSAAASEWPSRLARQPVRARLARQQTTSAAYHLGSGLPRYLEPRFWVKWAAGWLAEVRCFIPGSPEGRPTSPHFEIL